MFLLCQACQEVSKQSEKLRGQQQNFELRPRKVRSPTLLSPCLWPQATEQHSITESTASLVLYQLAFTSRRQREEVKPRRTASSTREGPTGLVQLPATFKRPSRYHRGLWRSPQVATKLRALNQSRKAHEIRGGLNNVQPREMASPSFPR